MTDSIIKKINTNKCWWRPRGPMCPAGGHQCEGFSDNKNSMLCLAASFPGYWTKGLSIDIAERWLHTTVLGALSGIVVAVTLRSLRSASLPWCWRLLLLSCLTSSLPHPSDLFSCLCSSSLSFIRTISTPLITTCVFIAHLARHGVQLRTEPPLQSQATRWRTVKGLGVFLLTFSMQMWAGVLSYYSWVDFLKFNNKERLLIVCSGQWLHVFVAWYSFGNTVGLQGNSSVQLGIHCKEIRNY